MLSWQPHYDQSYEVDFHTCRCFRIACGVVPFSGEFSEESHPKGDEGIFATHVVYSDSVRTQDFDVILPHLRSDSARLHPDLRLVEP